MSEYFGNPKKTSETIDLDGWLKTGDLAKFDSDGNCTIIGRIDDIITVVKEKISPKEIEDFLLSHPKIKDIQVFGVPDPHGINHIITAWIILKQCHQSITTDELKSFFQGKKSLLKFPQHIEIVYGLIDLGIRKGDYIAIWSPNRLEPLLLYFSLAKIGAISVNLYPYFASEEFKEIMTLTQCKALFFWDEGIIESSGVNYLTVLKEIIPELKSQSPTLNSDKFPNLKFIIPINDNDTNNFQRLIHRGKEVMENGIIKIEDYESLVSVHDPYQILLTSGSTGKHKLIVQSQYSFINNSIIINNRVGLTSDDVMGNIGKLFHVSGKLHMTMMAIQGSTIVLIVNNDIFNPSVLLRAIEKYRVTTLGGTPTSYFTIQNHPDLGQYNISTVKKGLLGAFQLSHSIGESLLNIGFPVVHFYGMSESLISFSTNYHSTTKKEFIETVGRVFPHCSAKIVNEIGQIVEIGEIGELVVKSISNMYEYYGNPKKNSETLDSDGWLKTGDLAKFDTDGNCIIIGRMDDIITVVKEKVSPKEIEDFLLSHPKIKDIQVFGVPDPVGIHDIITAWIILKPGHQSITTEELKSYFQGKKSLVKVPQHIELVSEFPSNANSKPMKKTMKEITFEKFKLNSLK
eukprot:gene3235-4049_t